MLTILEAWWNMYSDSVMAQVKCVQELLWPYNLKGRMGKEGKNVKKSRAKNTDMAHYGKSYFLTIAFTFL